MKPTSQQVEVALDEAQRLRELGHDDHHLAKTVLHLEARVRLLEDVLAHAKLYLHSGEGGIEHAQLVRAIERAEYGADAEDIKPW
jgi:hypothetical protein